jgi:hypothetical protein
MKILLIVPFGHRFNTESKCLFFQLGKSSTNDNFFMFYLANVDSGSSIEVFIFVFFDRQKPVTPEYLV